MAKPVVWLREAGPRVDGRESEPATRAVAVVVEDDTYHVLSALPIASEESEPNAALLKKAEEVWPSACGSIRIEDDEFTLRMHAVVYDLDAEPPCREEWVAQALDESLRMADRLSVRKLALPPLGTRLGVLSVERFTELLAAVIERIDLHNVMEIWLLTPAEAFGSVSRSLRRLGVELRTEDRSRRKEE